MNNAAIAQQEAQELAFVAGELDTEIRRAPLNTAQMQMVQQDIGRFGAVEGLYTGTASCPTSVVRMATSLVDMTVDRDVSVAGPITDDAIDQGATDLDRLRYTATAVQRDLQAGGLVNAIS